MVRDFLADGREVKSVEGFVIPTTGPTAAAYRIAAEFLQNHPETIQKREGDTSETAQRRRT